MSVTDSAIQETPVLIEQAGSLGRIRLNRPKALNSLTLDMVRRIADALDQFEADPRIAAVLITGAGERGLCAGGDIRALYESGRAGTTLGETFWREEYVLNARIKNFPKPYIAIMDGITMGGGVGLSAHGSHRIVTDRTRLAMPETGIGFFPDVGGTWLLAHGPGEIGTYLGLTGEQIGAADAIYAGLADVCVPISALPGLVQALETLPAGAGGDRVTLILEPLALPAGPAPLQERRAEIDQAFAADEIETILASLARLDTEFAHKTRATLLSKSPTSLKLTVRLLRLARASTSLEDCLEREFAAGRRVFSGHDFYEGVRAAVIDKDRTPRWSPASLDAVGDSDVDAYLIAAPEPVFPARSGT
ncbi:MAG TPA: enoyl-CoA hydratase/isomerase family protein [Bradyrhizobium sp.]|nr:enoyl-CoA hydratase/isomerase family protein [Bradyrhizobium sp.]